MRAFHTFRIVIHLSLVLGHQSASFSLCNRHALTNLPVVVVIKWSYHMRALYTFRIVICPGLVLGQSAFFSLCNISCQSTNRESC